MSLLCDKLEELIIFTNGKDMVTLTSHSYVLAIVCFVLIGLVVYWCWPSGSKESLSQLPFRRSVYFQVIDDQGTHSIIHELKKEINDRNATVLMSPEVIKYGFHPGNLDGTIMVKPEDIEDYGDYYVVRASLP